MAGWAMKCYLADYRQQIARPTTYLRLKVVTWFSIQGGRFQPQCEWQATVFASGVSTTRANSLKAASIYSAKFACPNTNWFLKHQLQNAEQERIRQRFLRAGLDSDRLILLEWIEGN